MTQQVEPDEPTPIGLADRERRARRRLGALAPHWRSLVALAKQKGAGQDAEDIATEALLRAAWSDTLDDRAPLRFLQRTVQNLVIDCHRRASHREWVGRRAADVARQPPLEDHVINRDLALRTVRRIRDTAGDVTALLVWRRLVDEVAWPQLAAEFGMSPSRVQSSVRRAIQNLRPWLVRQLHHPQDLA